MIIKAGLFVFVAALLTSPGNASCGCICSETLVAQPYIIELAATGECNRPTGITDSQCYDIDCAKCGQSLECYVNTGDAAVDMAICDIVNDPAAFCPTQRGPKLFSACGQQCSGRDGVSCFPGESWGTCPAVLGSFGGTAKCKFGANGGPAALSNFASYTVCTGTAGASCEASGSCTADGSSFSCQVTSPCMQMEAVTCLNDKCDTGTSGDGTCPCA
eukprot:TRINITY_DN71389_c0_g1_i1.p1 TRINITY_DN71389_c0_g1~~TRINITY_DN71389_c0_g1_i1.p1  ORF type:complete len:217 (+),score=10.46 TRINITY_DN71389_c0_g1_i1:118-768(+)